MKELRAATHTRSNELCKLYTVTHTHTPKTSSGHTGQTHARTHLSVSCARCWAQVSSTRGIKCDTMREESSHAHAPRAQHGCDPRRTKSSRSLTRRKQLCHPRACALCEDAAKGNPIQCDRPRFGQVHCIRPLRQRSCVNANSQPFRRINGSHRY